MSKNNKNLQNATYILFAVVFVLIVVALAWVIDGQCKRKHPERWKHCQYYSDNTKKKCHHTSYE
jgi:hypothetical protein